MRSTQGAGVRRASFSNSFEAVAQPGDNAQSGVPREVAVSTAPASGSTNLFRLGAVSLLLATGAAFENNTNATSLPNASIAFDPSFVGNVTNATDHVVRITGNLTNTSAPPVQVHVDDRAENWTDAPTTNYRAADDEGDMNENDSVKLGVTVGALALICCAVLLAVNMQGPCPERRAR